MTSRLPSSGQSSSTLSQALTAWPVAPLAAAARAARSRQTSSCSASPAAPVLGDLCSGTSGAAQQRGDPPVRDLSLVGEQPVAGRLGQERVAKGHGGCRGGQQ